MAMRGYPWECEPHTKVHKHMYTQMHTYKYTYTHMVGPEGGLRRAVRFRFPGVA